MIIRLAAFHQTLHQGQFPVRYLFSLNHGYGYPVLNFLYPLPFYFGEVIHHLGLGFIDTIKTLFILSFLLSAGSMYLLVSRKWGTWPAFIAALFYTYAPYRIFDVYHRGSLGEAVAFIFIPLVFYFVETNLPLAALTFAALICSHNTLAFMISPLILLFTLRKLSLSKTFIFFTLTLGLSAFFWFPALYDLKYTRASVTQVSDFTRYFLTTENFLPLVGLLTPASLILVTTNLPLIIVSLTSLFLSSPYSSSIWLHSPLPQLVQFPWRFLSVTVFSTALLLGFASHKIKWWPFNLILAGAILLLSLPVIKVIPLNKTDDYYSTNDATTTVQNEYMPIWIKSDPAVATDQKYIYLNPTTIRINEVYFPGLKIYVDGSETNFNFKNSGYPEFSVAPGGHQIKSIFSETSPRQIADLISLFALILLLILLARQRH